MIFEKFNFHFQIEALVAEFEKFSKAYPPVMVSQTFGGWSLTSSDGSYRDGWIKEAYAPPVEAKTIEDIRKHNASLNVASTKSYRTPTEICSPIFQDMLRTWEDAGLSPRRVRFLMLLPGGTTAYHRDYPDWLYGVRLHVPIVTNTNCFFEVDEGRAHLPADGSAYFLKVNRMHKAYNEGETPRVHLVADVYDTKAITQFHHFKEEDRKNYGLSPS
jgi:hypothetical protein